MILVTVGTNGPAFDRLIGAIPAVADELVVQHGPSKIRPAGARCVAYFPFDELKSLMDEARLIVTHGGVGSILMALSAGKSPIVMPRRAALREAVDDHQVGFVDHLAKAGIVRSVTPADLRAALESAPAPNGNGHIDFATGGLTDELAAYLAAVCGPPSTDRAAT
jgi:UDP-N-acetylglucosamine transferase subunit ALG13